MENYAQHYSDTVNSIK